MKGKRFFYVYVVNIMQILLILLHGYPFAYQMNDPAVKHRTPNHPPEMITILGPTASGKTAFAAHLAKEMGGEIISADSRQVYRGMDIGTGKDLDDYQIGCTHIPYHLIDIADAGTKYNLFQYQEDFRRVYDDIRSRGATPILCGGTGLYIEAVLRGYSLSPVPQNPELRTRLSKKSLSELTQILLDLKARTGSKMHNKTDIDSCQRAIRAIEIESHNLHHPTTCREMTPVESLIVGIDIPVDERRRRITERLRYRLAHGMIEEINRLLERGIPSENLIYYGLEYKFVTAYVLRQISYQEMFDKLEIAIHQFAKRQMTWFRGMERRGLKIHWLDASLPLREKMDKVIRLLKDLYPAETI